MAKINGNEIRVGNVLDHNGGLWVRCEDRSCKTWKGRRICAGGNEKPAQRIKAE